MSQNLWSIFVTIGRVWCYRGEPHHPANVVAHDRYGRGSVRVWAGITERDRTNLHIVDGNVNGEVSKNFF